MKKKYLLGEGVFAVNATPVGLTRGGGTFVVEREFHEVQADGDRGPVKNRVRKINAVPKLTMNMLEIIPENLVQQYAALKVTTVDKTTTITGCSDIQESDYQDTVTWTGKLADGRKTVITIDNAINLENIDWAMAPKDEVIPVITWTGCYNDEDGSPINEQDEPFKIEFIES